MVGEGSGQVKAERVLLETDAHGNLIDVPRLPPNARLEAIFLVLGELTVPPAKGTPPLISKESVSTLEGAMEPATSEEWPAGYFEETYGALAEDPLARPPQGDLREEKND